MCLDARQPPKAPSIPRRQNTFSSESQLILLTLAPLVRTQLTMNIRVLLVLAALLLTGVVAPRKPKRKASKKASNAIRTAAKKAKSNKRRWKDCEKVMDPASFFSRPSDKNGYGYLDTNGYGLVSLAGKTTKTLELQPKLTRFTHMQGTSHEKTAKKDARARRCCPKLGNNGELFKPTTPPYNLCPQVWATNHKWTYYQNPNKCTKMEKTENSQQAARAISKSSTASAASTNQRVSPKTTGKLSTRANADEPCSPSEELVWKPNDIKRGPGNFAAAHVEIQIMIKKDTWQPLPGEWLIPVSGFANTYSNRFPGEQRAKGFSLHQSEATRYNDAWHTLREDLIGNKAVTAIQTRVVQGQYPAYPRPR